MQDPTNAQFPFSVVHIVAFPHFFEQSTLKRQVVFDKVVTKRCPTPLLLTANEGRRAFFFQCSAASFLNFYLFVLINFLFSSLAQLEQQ